MTSDYVIVSIICPEVGNGEYIILLKSCGLSVSGFEDTEGVLPSVPFGRGNRVNIILCIFSCFPSCNDRMTFFRLLDFQAAFDKRLASWKNENDKLTRDACTSLLKLLKQEHLDPILEKLHGGEGAQVSFEDIIQGYNRLEQDFKVKAIGAKDVSAAVFFEFHPVKSCKVLTSKRKRGKF